jgi:FixJ family two-component response regulator
MPRRRVPQAHCRLPRGHATETQRDRKDEITRMIGTSIALARTQRPAIGLLISEAPVVHIIDDDESLRAAVDSLLRSVGLQTRGYASVNEFLAARRPDAAGCLILDVRLPGISGLDFQARLTTLDIHLPVILMTGHGDIPMSVRGMKAGAIGFLTKPFRDQDMLDAVTTAIGRHRVQRAADAENANLPRSRRVSSR